LVFSGLIAVDGYAEDRLCFNNAQINLALCSSCIIFAALKLSLTIKYYDYEEIVFNGSTDVLCRCTSSTGSEL
jgi:hypothetical protein